MSYPVYYDGEFEVAPSLTEQDITQLLAVTNLEKNGNTRAVFEAIEASEEPDLPWHGGLIRYRREVPASRQKKERAGPDLACGWNF